VKSKQHREEVVYFITNIAQKTSSSSNIITGSVLIDSLEMEEEEEEQEEDRSSSDTEGESGIEEEEEGLEGEYREAAVGLTWASEVVFYEFLEEH
jgi:hypothetical protein